MSHASKPLTRMQEMLRMKKENTIHPTALIGPGVVLGKGNYIGPYCVIGFPCESRKNWHNELAGRVLIGDNNTFTGLVTIDAGMDDTTTVGDNCFLMKHSHVGHDAILCGEVTVSPGSVIGGHAFVGASTNLGINCSIHQRVIIPPNCMIGMGAVITKKTTMRPGYKYAGVPARELGENKR